MELVLIFCLFSLSARLRCLTLFSLSSVISSHFCQVASSGAMRWRSILPLKRSIGISERSWIGHFDYHGRVMTIREKTRPLTKYEHAAPKIVLIISDFLYKFPGREGHNTQLYSMEE